MARLIYADDVQEKIVWERDLVDTDNMHGVGMHNGLSMAHAIVLTTPSVDAVEVVRCKDCKHYKSIECCCSCTIVSEDWYCASGERKDNESNIKYS